MSELDDFITEQIHNEKVRKNIKKFHETGRLLDDEGKKIDIGNIVNFEVVEK